MSACLSDSGWPWVLLMKEGAVGSASIVFNWGPIIFGEKILEGVRRGL